MGSNIIRQRGLYGKQKQNKAPSKSFFVAAFSDCQCKTRRHLIVFLFKNISLATVVIFAYSFIVERTTKEQNKIGLKV